MGNKGKDEGARGLGELKEEFEEEKMGGKEGCSASSSVVKVVACGWLKG
jgi:hypothetical protein